VVFGAKLQRLEVSPILFLILLLAIATVIFVHGRFLLHLEGEHRRTSGALVTTEHDFQQMADNIQEVTYSTDRIRFDGTGVGSRTPDNPRRLCN